MYFVLGSCASLGVVSVAARSFLNKSDRFISRADFFAEYFWAYNFFASSCFWCFSTMRLHVAESGAARYSPDEDHGFLLPCISPSVLGTLNF